MSNYENKIACLFWHLLLDDATEEIDESQSNKYILNKYFIAIASGDVSEIEKTSAAMVKNNLHDGIKVEGTVLNILPVKESGICGKLVDDHLFDKAAASLKNV